MTKDATAREVEAANLAAQLGHAALCLDLGLYSVAEHVVRLVQADLLAIAEVRHVR